MVVNVSESSDNALCPRYGNCETARALNEDFCTNSKCNTFYQIDTLRFFNQAQDAMKNRNGSARTEKDLFIDERFRGYNGRRLIGKRWFESVCID